MLEESQAAPEIPPGASERFACPVCNASVDASATACPGCGAQFVEEEAAEFECPLCKAPVAADASVCPSCGVHFAEEEEAEQEPPAAAAPAPPARPPPTAPGPPVATVSPGVRITLRDRLAAVREAKREAPNELPMGDRKLMYRELPKLVNEVKALLVTAKRIGMQIEQEKSVINEAIAAGKRRDIERAVQLIDQARHAMDIAFTAHIGARIEAFANEIQRVGGPSAASNERALQDAVNHLETGAYENAWDVFQSVSAGFQAQTKDLHEARGGLERDERLLSEARRLGMRTGDFEKLIRQGREVATRGDMAGAAKVAHQVRERLSKELPEFINEEMKRARNVLLDKKMRGGDLSKPIGILKAASVHVKKEEWLDAIRYLSEFRREIEAH